MKSINMYDAARLIIAGPFGQSDEFKKLWLDMLLPLISDDNAEHSLSTWSQVTRMDTIESQDKVVIHYKSASLPGTMETLTFPLSLMLSILLPQVPVVSVRVSSDTYAARETLSLGIPSAFTRDLAALINRYSLESASNTPDFILAEMLTAHLAAYNETSTKLAKWGKQPVVPFGLQTTP